MDKKMVPEVRFKGFYDDWEQVKLGNISKKITKKNRELNNYPVLSNSAQKGIVNQNDYFDKSIAVNTNSYYVIQQNDFVYNPRISNLAPFGPIRRNNLDISGVISPLYYCFRLNELSNVGFLDFYFKTDKWYKFMYQNGDTGARSDRIAIKDSVFQNLLLSIPNKSEQKKISRLLKLLEDYITLQQQQLDLYTKLKKGLLQKLFPKDGEKVPDVRFADFTGNWEQRKFNSFIIKSGERNNKDISYDIYSVNNKKGLINQDSQFEKGRLSRLNKKMYKMVKPSEFVYNPARINVGSIAYNNLGISVMVSSLYVVFRLNEKIDDNFTMSFIKSKRFTDEVMRNTEGSVRQYLFFDNIKNVKIPFCNDLNEQKKISKLLEKIDEIIFLQQKKTQNLKLLKKYLLQKLFI